MIKIIDDKSIEVDFNGNKIVMQRYCPHEGADLSLGYIDGDVIRCPWHNLPIDKNGQTPCKNLKCKVEK